MRKILIVLGLILILVSLFNISCASDEDVSPVKEFLTNADQALGIEIPWPHYLPEGYEITGFRVNGKIAITLTMSNSKATLLELRINWKPEGGIPYKFLPDFPTVEFNGITGQFRSDGENDISLIWNWSPERYKPGLIVLTLSAPVDFPVSELTSIAGSVGWD